MHMFSVKHLMGAGVCLLALGSGTAMAQGITGYAYDKNGQPINSMLGCVRTKNWLKQPVIGCDGYEGEPEVVEEPIPDPMPVVVPVVEEEKVVQEVTYEFGQRITFEYDSAQLTPRAKAILRDNVEQVREKMGRAKKVHLIGRTDNRGNDDYNERLALRRAEAVKAYLLELGAKEEIFELEARGSALPLFPNLTEEGRRGNRTTDVFIIVEE